MEEKGMEHALFIAHFLLKYTDSSSHFAATTPGRHALLGLRDLVVTSKRLHLDVSVASECHSQVRCGSREPGILMGNCSLEHI